MHAVEVPFGREADLGGGPSRQGEKEKGESNIRNMAFLFDARHSSFTGEAYVRRRRVEEIRSDRALKIIGWESKNGARY